MPGYVKISFQELNIHTTNRDWFPAYTSESDVHYREINFIGLSITLNIAKSVPYGSFPLKTPLETTASPLVPTYLPRKSLVRITQTPQPPKDMSEDSEDKSSQQNNSYLLFPLNLNVKIKQMLNLTGDVSEEPEKSVWIELKDPMTIIINKNQIQFLRALNEHVSSLNVVQKNIHLRPTQHPKENPKAWWKYAYKALLESKTMDKLFNNPISVVKMRKYIHLYKIKQNIVRKIFFKINVEQIYVPWLPRIAPAEKKLIAILEHEISLDNLLKFREWALLEIRVEARRYFVSE